MNIILLNEDNLSNNHPVFEVAKQSGDYKTIFIFDEEYLNEQNFSFKKIVFIYECLQDINCDIYKGETLNVIDEISPSKILIPKTINPFFIKKYNKLAEKYDIEIVDQVKFIELNKQPDLKRFFRYWNKAKKQIKKSL